MTANVVLGIVLASCLVYAVLTCRREGREHTADQVANDAPVRRDSVEDEGGRTAVGATVGTKRRRAESQEVKVLPARPSMMIALKEAKATRHVALRDEE